MVANRKGKNRSDKRKIQPVQPKKSLKLLLVPVIVLVIVVVILVSYEYGLFDLGNTSSSGIPVNIPSSLQPGYFAKISDSNVGNRGTVSVYFLSWYGCPIGAAESWIIYNFTTITRTITGTSKSFKLFFGCTGCIFRLSLLFFPLRFATIIYQSILFKSVYSLQFIRVYMPSD